MESLMDKCTKERIKIASLRGGLTGAAGLALWFISGWMSSKYGVDLTVQAQAGISLVGLLGTWFATKPMFSFTEECMLMQEAKTARPKAADTKTVYMPQARVAAATPKVKAVKPAPTQPTATLATGKLVAQGRVLVEVARVEGTATQVIVSTSGLSASEFKGNNGNGGLRQRLEGIGGIKWENPKNLGEGKRTMTGTVKTNNEGELAAKLIEVASRYSR
jgi:hypothetical protein